MLLHNLFEDFTSQDDRLNIDYSSGGMTKLGKGKAFQPYIAKGINVAHHPVHSVYKMVQATDVMSSIKGKGPYEVDQNDYQQFLKRTSIFLHSKVIRPNKIDVVITPKSSSNILNDLLQDLQQRAQGIEFYPEYFVKSIDPSQIKIDTENPKMTPKILAGLQGVLNKAVKDGYLEMKKFDKRFVKFVSNYFSLAGPLSKRVTEQTNILVLDDVLASGATFVELFRNLEGYPHNNLIGASIFKT
jgi:hypothetical protein